MDKVQWLPRLFERLSERSYFDRDYILYLGSNEFSEFYERHFEVVDKGIYIHDLTIPFPLLLHSERKKYLVRFARCNFEDEVSFNWGDFDALEFLDCNFNKHFSAKAISVKGRINVEGCNFYQGIDLTAAQLGGDLKFVKTTIDDGGEKTDSIREYVALFAAGIKAHSAILQEVTITGRAFFGTAQLRGILKVTGNLRCPLRTHASERLPEWDHIAFDATDAKIQGQVIFGEESKIRKRQPKSTPPIEVHGQINLTNAVLGGDLICSGATLHSAFCNVGGNQSSFDSPQYAALYASRLEVDGAILLDNQFSSVGEIRLNSIRTRGLIQCRDARLSGIIPGVDQQENVVKALSLRNSRIGSSVYLDQNSKFTGLVDLHAIVIDADLDLRSAECMAYAKSNIEKNARQTNLDHSPFRRFMTLVQRKKRNGDETERRSDTRQQSKDRHGALDARCCVELSGARINGSAHLCATEHYKNELAKLRDTGRDFLVEERFRASGCVRLRGARIQGNLHFEGALFSRVNDASPRERLLNCQSTTVGGTTFLAERGGAISDYDAAVTFDGAVSFEGMTTNTWEDSPRGWPLFHSNGNFDDGRYMEINGLSYQFLKGPLSGPKRLAWLLNQPPEDIRKLKNHDPSGFKSQPWEQCAKVLSESGYSRDAKFILRMQQRFIRLYGELLTIEQIYNGLLGVLVGYGHRAMYALWWAIMLIVCATIWFQMAWQFEQITPAQEEVLISVQNGDPIPDDYPKFSAALYSLDVILPVGDFHQHDYWTTRKEGLRKDFKPKLSRVPGAIANSPQPWKFILSIVILVVLFRFWRLSIGIPLSESIPPYKQWAADNTADGNWAKLYKHYVRGDWSPAFSWIRYVGLPLIAVATVNTLFFVVIGSFLLAPHALSTVYRWLEIASQFLFSISYPSFLMMLFQVLGWILVSALIAGIGHNVFGHQR